MTSPDLLERIDHFLQLDWRIWLLVFLSFLSISVAHIRLMSRSQASARNAISSNFKHTLIRYYVWMLVSFSSLSLTLLGLSLLKLPYIFFDFIGGFATVLGFQILLYLLSRAWLNMIYQTSRSDRPIV